MRDYSIMDSDNSELKIITWNINGLRSFDDFPEKLRSFNADILCFQETKVTRDQLPEPLAIIPGYSSYYAFTRNGSGAYSGVATYVRNTCTPQAAEEGITGYLNKIDGTSVGAKLLKEEFTQDELKLLDYEGRCVITKHKIKSIADKYLYVINLYCPRADPEREDRKIYKLEFYKAVDIRANSLADEGNYVIVLGDINTSHREIDHCDPYEDFHDHPGRRFLDHFLDQGENMNNQHSSSNKQESNSLQDDVDGSITEDAWRCARVNINQNQFYDTFRIFHGSRKEAFTCWNTKLNCRSTNYGTRIDYIFISKEMKSLASYCDINPDILGSDHCPVTATFQLEIEASSRIPSTATKYFPEFQGRQLSIKDMMQNATKPAAKLQLSIKRNTTTFGTNSQPAVKKAKPAKITNFFAPKKVAECEQDVNINVISSAAKSEMNQVSSVREVVSDETSNHFGARSAASKEAWSKLFQAPAPAPLCSGHQDQCVKRKVTKKGPNQGREFYCCPRGEGRADDPKARCNFFKWAKSR